MAQAPQGSESGTGGTEAAASTTAAVTATQEQNNPTTTATTSGTTAAAATPATTSTTAPAATSGTTGTTGAAPTSGGGGSGNVQRGATLGSGTNKFASSSLYVGDLSKDVTEATLFELFNAVGPVASIRVCRDGATRQSLGYAYVNFHSTKDAERALDTMNFANIKGKQCRIMWSQRDPSLRRSNRGNVFVKCLHESIDNKTLYDTFSVFGNILSCKVATNEDGSSRQYGYVHYVDEASAKKAIEGVNGMSINNKVVEACAFQPRSEREKNLSFTNVYVKYIPRHCDESMCKDAFTKLVSDKIGEETEITHSKFWVQNFGVSGCFNFKKHEQAKAAVDILNGFDLRTIYPEPDTDKDVTAANDDEKDVKDENATDANNDEEKDNAVTTEEKDATNDTEEQKEEKAAIVGVVAGNKDLNKKSQQRSLFATRAVKRKTRDFLLAKERGVRGGYGRGGGTRGGIRPNARYYLGGNLYVKHLLPEIDDEKLKEMFASFGEIQSAKVMKQDSGESKGFGFVAFKTKDAATRALHEMNMKQQHGPGAKPLYVSRAQSKHARISRRMSYMNRFGGQGGSGRGGGRGGYNNNNNMYQGVFSNRGGNQGNQGGGYNPNYNRGYTPAGGIYGPAGMVNPNQNLSNMNQNQGLNQNLINNQNQAINVNAQQQNLMNMGGIPGAIGNVGVPGIANVQRMGPGGITQMGPTGIPNTANPRMLQQYGGAAAAAAMQGNITNPLVNQNFFNRGGPSINNALQQLFPFQTQLGPQTAMNIGGQNTNTSGVPNVGNINPSNRGNIGGQQGGISSTGVLNNPQGINLGAQQQSFNNQQTSQTNQMIGRNLQNVTALPSTGTANVTNPASSAQMQFPQSVPRTQFSVQSGGIGITQSQQQSQPTNASVPQGGQSASVLSAGGRDSAAMKESHPLTQQMLSRIATPAEKKRLIGERLFPKIQVVEPRLAGKITGMLLEMDNKILLTLLNDNTALHGKINEALAVLQEHHKSQQNASNANRASSSNAPQ